MTRPKEKESTFQEWWDEVMGDRMRGSKYLAKKAWMAGSMRGGEMRRIQKIAPVIIQHLLDYSQVIAPNVIVHVEGCPVCKLLDDVLEFKEALGEVKV